MQRRSVVPLLLGGLLVLGIGLGLWLKFAGTKHDQAQAEQAQLAASASASAAAGPTPLTAVSPLSPDTAESARATKPATKSAVHPAPAEKNVAPEIAELKSGPPNGAVGTTPGASAHPAARLERCYADPFTGQIRVAGASHGEPTFACRQNAFTGAYQRL